MFSKKKNELKKANKHPNELIINELMNLIMPFIYVIAQILSGRTLVMKLEQYN